MKCLKSLMGQTWDDLEVIVVDDGGAADLSEVKDNFSSSVRFLRQDNTGPAGARNYGVGSTDAELIAFTDDDCEPAADWIECIVAEYRETPDAMIGGRTVNSLRSNIYSEASQILIDYLYNYFGAEEGDMPYFTSNNFACERKAFLELGGFDVSFPAAAAEDRDFGMRWRVSGRPMKYCPQCVINHAHNLSIVKYFRQHMNYGRGAKHLHTNLKRQKLRPPKIEGPNFYLGMIRYAFSHEKSRSLRIASLLMLSQAATAAGYFSENRKSDKK